MRERWCPDRVSGIPVRARAAGDVTHVTLMHRTELDGLFARGHERSHVTQPIRVPNGSSTVLLYQCLYRTVQPQARQRGVYTPGNQ